ncbi:hypothetical protein IFO70_15375 [Phormidium tenue FACHB-886]|nr:hypothetical protein [Phormidium tenue FACHB-886]
MKNIREFLEAAIFLDSFKRGVWLLGTTIGSCAVLNRSLTALMDGHLTELDLIELLATSCLLIGWLELKPRSLINRENFNG